MVVSQADSGTDPKRENIQHVWCPRNVLHHHSPQLPKSTHWMLTILPSLCHLPPSKQKRADLLFSPTFKLVAMSLSHKISNNTAWGKQSNITKSAAYHDDQIVSERLPQKQYHKGGLERLLFQQQLAYGMLPMETWQFYKPFQAFWSSLLPMKWN